MLWDVVLRYLSSDIDMQTVQTPYRIAFDMILGKDHSGLNSQSPQETIV